MSSASIIRITSVDDAAQIQRIYAPFVRDTPISFEVEPPSIEEMQQRIENTLQRFPWLVCEHQSEVVGYVYASSHSNRAAYSWSVNVSVYIHQRCHRSGVGKALYASLFEVLRLQGFYNAYAGATLPNPASVGLHEAMGFQPVGFMRLLVTSSVPGIASVGGSWHYRNAPQLPPYPYQWMRLKNVPRGRHLSMPGCSSLSCKRTCSRGC